MLLAIVFTKGSDMRRALNFFARVSPRLTFFLAFFCGFYSARICQSQGGDKPLLTLKLSEKYLGEMQVLDVASLQPGTTNSILFDVVNELPEKIDLDKIRLSCGCMRAALTVKIIEPNQSAQLRLDLKLDLFDTNLNRTFVLRS